MPDVQGVVPPDVFNQLVLNSAGKYKGGVEINKCVPKDGLFIIRIYRVDDGKETLCGEVKTPPVKEPDKGREWFPYVRAWVEQDQPW